MSRKTVLFLLIGVVYLVLIAFGLTMVYSVGTPVAVKKPVITSPDNKISIAHTEIFGKLERPQVIFDHKKHEEASKQEGCTACHPVNDKNKVLFDFPKKIKGKGKKAVMNAFHDQCIECHKKSAQENKKTGPVTCNDCHKKQLAKVEMKYPVFEFDFAYHDKHVKKLKEKIGKDDCGQCHHIYNPEEKKLSYKEGTEESCVYCHDLTAKRGPELTAITKVSAEKGLTIRKASHLQCINCHLEYQKKGDKETGPTECVKCHTGKYKTLAELEKVARPDRKQKNISYIDIESSRMKGVTFDHKSHQTYSKNCVECHHETLKACKECHSLTGKPEGNGINIANAYHNVFSRHSCAGCHNQIKAKKECAGCHHLLAPMDIGTMNPKQTTCAICHSGKKDQISLPKPLSTAGISQDKLKKEVEVKVLEKEYEPSKFPHLDIVNKLAKISNDSRLATYFHRDIQTLCEGCHHRSTTSAEAQKDTPPNCKNCHMTAYDKQNLNKVRLLSAYHRQCLGCHEKMELDKGRKCSECHKEKAGGPAEITRIKNDHVVKQNTTNIINEWRPK